MDTLNIPLITLFKSQNPYKILVNYFVENKFDNYSKINSSDFMYYTGDLCKKNSKEEIENIYEVTLGEMKKKVQGVELEKNVFNLFINYTENLLIDQGSNVQCKYKDLLKWRVTTHKLDQDLFISAFFAYKDLLIGRDRISFNWDTTIKSNNVRLHNLLSKGMAENHFHLKGSAPTFNLSWVSLMNNIKNRNLERYEKEEYRLSHEYDKNFNIPDMVVIAAYIREILFKHINHLSIIKDILGLEEIIKGCSKNENLMIKTKISEIKSEVDILIFLFGKNLNYRNKQVKVDYAYTENLAADNLATRLFSGERAFMYTCFKLIYKQDKEFKKYIDLFYAYIIIKSKFRGEMIQNNDKVGFSNFADYQDRKTQFIPINTILRDAVEPTAILTSIKNQNILSLEARVIPSKKAEENVREINRIDNIICNRIFNDNQNKWINDEDSRLSTRHEQSISQRKVFEDANEYQEIERLKDKYFYVFHFPKKKDPDIKLGNNKNDMLVLASRCRHYEYRKDLKKYCNAIYTMREKNGKEARRVLGIDACSNELVMRPEVYGQAFRFLKAHLASENFQKPYNVEENINILRATYHVGEDFLDVVDGLRAIDESVTFLNLTHGDRIGHAIVLGIDVDDWYKEKSFKVSLTKQDILDNVAWLISKIIQFNIEDGAIIIPKLTLIYNKYYLDIFDSNLIPYIGSKDKKQYTDMQVVPVDTYIEAWKLRGDNPEYYMDDTLKKAPGYWHRCAKRSYNSEYEQVNLVKNLYLNYHYNPDVKIKGYKKEIFKVERYMIEVIKKVQKGMQDYIRQCNIGIECNPTSNYLISNFGRYDKHPILNLYNLGLTVDQDKVNANPQLFVSINTDDQGVFGTLLENEYALMGIALEKAKDANGKPLYNQSMIYDWLDRVRRMGIEQSFGLKSGNV